MNERIKDLAFQAMSINQNVSDDSFFVEVSKLKEFEKFAELIVRECADVLAAEMNRLDVLNRVVASQTMDTAQVLIKKHFGVKE